MRRLSLGLHVGRAPGSGVGVSLCLALLGRADVGLGLLVGPLHSAVVVVVVVVSGGGRGGGGSGCGSTHLGFGMQTHTLSGFLAVVLRQTVALQGLFALVVRAVVARGWGQVAVLGPDGRGQRVVGEFGFARLDVLLQELVDG